MRNRILNGRMRINRRHPYPDGAIDAALHTYCIDHYSGTTKDSSGGFTMQQESDGPGDCPYYCRIKVTATAGPGSADINAFEQKIFSEDIRDLGFGCSGAKQFTLFFRVRCSLTGTFGGSFRNSNSSARSYPFTYTVSSANTWEQKSITITADTSGTWYDSVDALDIFWDIGSGSGTLGSAGSWQSATYRGATGCVALIATMNATLDITDVVLGTSSTLADYDVRGFDEEMFLTSRFCEKSYQLDTLPGTNTSAGSRVVMGTKQGSYSMSPTILFQTPKCIAPTVKLYGPDGTPDQWAWTDSSGTTTYRGTNVSATKEGFQVYQSGDSNSLEGQGHFVVDGCEL